MRTAVFAALAALAVAGPAAAETRTLSLAPFSAIEAATGVDVVVSVGPAQSVSLEGPAAGIDRIDVRSENGVLKVRHKRGVRIGWSNNTESVRVVVSAPRIEAIAAESAAEVRATGFTGGVLAAAASSGGEIRLAGTCASLTARGESGGDIRGEGLLCQQVAVSASSGADVRLGSAGATVTASASSGGAVELIGQPARLQQNASSGGDVDVRG